MHYKPTDSHSYLLHSSSHLSHLSKVTVYAIVCTTNPQILIVICCIHLHIHHMSRIPFLILSFLDFVFFVVTTLIFHQNQRKCAISLTKVAILLLLFKRGIIAPKNLIDSQYYKRLKERTTLEFHSPSHFTLTTTQ